MSCATLVTYLSILGMPAETIESPRTGDRQEKSAQTLRQIEHQVTDALRHEAITTNSSKREAAILQLVAMHHEMSGDPRIDSSRTLQRLRMKVRARLRRAEKELVRDMARQSSSRSPGETAGARGGRAQRAPNNAQALIELIQATISPDSWDVNGGQSTVFYFAPRHALVVRAPAELHSRTRRLLIDLR